MLPVPNTSHSTIGKTVFHEVSFLRSLSLHFNANNLEIMNEFWNNFSNSRWMRLFFMSCFINNIIKKHCTKKDHLIYINFRIFVIKIFVCMNFMYII